MVRLRSYVNNFHTGVHLSNFSGWRRASRAASGGGGGTMSLALFTGLSGACLRSLIKR